MRAEMPSLPTRTAASCEMETNPGQECRARRTVRRREHASRAAARRSAIRSACSAGMRIRTRARGEHRVERPAGRFVPGHERDAVHDVHFRSQHDRVVNQRHVAQAVLPDREQHARRVELLGLQHAQAHEAALVGRVQGAKDGAERVLGELGDEEVVAEVARKQRGRCAQARLRPLPVRVKTARGGLPTSAVEPYPLSFVEIVAASMPRAGGGPNPRRHSGVGFVGRPVRSFT